MIKSYPKILLLGMHGIPSISRGALSNTEIERYESAEAIIIASTAFNKIDVEAIAVITDNSITMKAVVFNFLIASLHFIYAMLIILINYHLILYIIKYPLIKLILPLLI